MKVFFVASPRALYSYKTEIRSIYKTIGDLGHQNIYDLMEKTEADEFYAKNKNERREHYLRTVKSLQVADVVIIEASIHSLAIGYLVRMGEELNKPTIVLHLPDHEPFFFSGNYDDRFFVIEYSKDRIRKALVEAFEYAKDALNIRFNMYVTPQMYSNLKTIAKKNEMTCSTLVRLVLQKYISGGQNVSGENRSE